MKRAIIVLALVIALIYFVNAGISEQKLCEKTYSGVILNLTSQTLANEIAMQEKIGVEPAILQYYMENWERLCQEKTNISLNPKPICEGIYYLIVSTNYNYTESQLISKANQENVSVNAFKNYLENYDSLCLFKELSEELPKREFPELHLKEDRHTCDLQKDGIESFVFPKFEVYLGNVSCSSVKFINNFLAYEEIDGDYKISGVRTYWVGIFFMFSMSITLFSIIHQGKKANKLIERKTALPK